MSQANVDAARTYYEEPDPLTALADRIASDAEFDFTAMRFKVYSDPEQALAATGAA